LQQPHYGSDYFPGHAAILAAARAVTGNPWVGILAESAVFLAILFWMLRSWAIPPRWALFGVLLAALRFSIGSYWINAFHGGFLPAVGGALVAGAFARLRRSGSFYYGVVFGIGLAILASTRPFEGILFSVPFIAVLLWERRIVALVPAALVAGAAVCGLGV
jgi:hypothetical protein